MALAQDIALLNQVELFRALGDDKLRLIAFGAERRKLQGGQLLYREGAPADCAFVVAEGRFDLSRAARNGTQTPVDRVGRGTLLGELALVSPLNRTVTAIAAEPAEVLRINRPLFHRMLEEYPEIAALLHKRLADGLAEMTRQIGGLLPRFTD